MSCRGRNKLLFTGMTEQNRATGSVCGKAQTSSTRMSCLEPKPPPKPLLDHMHLMLLQAKNNGDLATDMPWHLSCGTDNNPVTFHIGVTKVLLRRQLLRTGVTGRSVPESYPLRQSPAQYHRFHRDQGSNVLLGIATKGEVEMNLAITEIGGFVLLIQIIWCANAVADHAVYARQVHLPPWLP